MGEEEQPRPTGEPAPTYGSDRGAPPPASYPYGSPPPPSSPYGSPPPDAPYGMSPPNPPYGAAPQSSPYGYPPPGNVGGPAGPPVIDPAQPYGPPGAPPPGGPGWYGPAGPPPYAGPARPAGTPEQVAVARRLGRLALIGAITAPVVTLLSLPWSAIPGVMFAIVAIVVGIRARQAAVAAGRSEAAGVVAIVLGSMGTALVAVIAGFYVLFWSELTDYQDCQAGANTLAAETTCRQQLEDDMRAKLGV